MTVYSGTLIYIGRLGKIDTDESNWDNENDNAVLGNYDNTQMSVVTLNMDDANEDGVITADDQGNTPEQLDYTLPGGPVTTTLDAEAIYNAFVTYGDGSTANTTIILIQAENGDTFVSLPDGTAVQNIQITSVHSDNYFGVSAPHTSSATVVCFAAQTLISTENGPVPANELRCGSRIETLDNGTQPIRWINARRVRAEGAAAPVRIKAGALGQGKPTRDLLVSQQHRILFRSRIAQRMLGRSEILIPAKKLLCLPGISVVNGKEYVDYVHILFDRHEIVFAEGAPTESLFLGKETKNTLAAELQAGMGTLFPTCLRWAHWRDQARPIVRGRKLDRLLQRHRQNCIAPLAPN